MNTRLFIITSITALSLMSCGNGSRLYKIPSMNDQYRFECTAINKGIDYHGFKKINNISIDIPEKYYIRDDFANFDSFLRDNNTLSFIILKNDSIIYEKYFYDTIIHPTTPIFSITKSFVSSLLGIAIYEGDIKSLDDPITDYIPSSQILLF